MKTIRHLLLLFIILIVIGCKKLPDYSTTPSIEFKEVEVIRNVINPLSTDKSDSIIVKIYFEDGDGDLGIANEDIQNSSFNYFFDIEKSVNGTFEPVAFLDGSNYNGKFPQLAPSNISRPIDGMLNFSFTLPYNNGLLVANDTLQFNLYIVDRSGNESNSVTTNSIIFNKQ